MRVRDSVFLVLAAVFGLACGGPAKMSDPDPTQSVAYYFAGTEGTGALHLHVHWVQNKHDITQLTPCVPVDTCNITPLNAQGQTELGVTNFFPVALSSASGTFGDPEISFTVTTANGKTFSFTGTVLTSGDQVQMQGTFSGPTHPASTLRLDKTPF